MKTKSKKIVAAQAANLAVQITRREAEAATSRADEARAVFKKARKAFKAARRAAKRAAKKAKAAEKNFAPLAKLLKAAKAEPGHKAQTKATKPKTKAAVKAKQHARAKSAADLISPPVSVSPAASAESPNQRST